MKKEKHPLILHVIYRLDIGGLERVVVNSINRMPDSYRHAIVSLTEVTDFADQIEKPVEIFALNKAPGKDLSSHWKLLKIIRQLKPDIMQTYNIATIEYQAIAWLLRVPGRVHAEHGREVDDPHGKNKKYNLLRKLLSPFIHRYVAVSADLEQWLVNQVGIKASKVKRICNGVDIDHFKPSPKTDSSERVFATIGRLDPVKDQATLIQAFSLLLAEYPNQPMKLQIVGDGPLMEQLTQQVADLGLQQQVKLLGARSDIAELLEQTDIFVLPSVAEGTPMTVLEAMAMGKPIIASAVGGLPELIDEGINGYLTESGNAISLKEAMARFINQPELILQIGSNNRKKAEQQYNQALCDQQYMVIYNQLLGL